MKIVKLVLIYLLLGGCTASNKSYDQDGEEALLCECGASVSFSVCHDRAKEECPNGYKVLSEDAGFNRKEIRVRCKNA